MNGRARVFSRQFQRLVCAALLVSAASACGDPSPQSAEVSQPQSTSTAAPRTTSAVVTDRCDLRADQGASTANYLPPELDQLVKESSFVGLIRIDEVTELKRVPVVPNASDVVEQGKVHATVLRSADSRQPAKNRIAFYVSQLLGWSLTDPAAIDREFVAFLTPAQDSTADYALFGFIPVVDENQLSLCVTDSGPKESDHANVSYLGLSSFTSVVDGVGRVADSTRTKD